MKAGDKCTNCGKALIDRPVSQDYAKHLVETQKFRMASSYLHCNNCGENYEAS